VDEAFHRSFDEGSLEGGHTLGEATIGHPRVNIYMARKDAILKMREILILRRDALRKALAGDLSLLKELREQTAGDVVDFALDSAQDEINSQLAEVESRELASIENALERMRVGHFGVCEGCAERIPMARLNALPYATLCIECQRESEKYGAGAAGDADWGRLIDNGSGDAELSINDLEIDVS
jgi:DnaK suppressor protein